MKKTTAKKNQTIEFDLKRTLSDDTVWIEELIQNRDVTYTVHVAEGTIEMTGVQLLPNAIIWRPLIKRKLPIKEVHRFDGELTANVQKRIHTAMHMDVITKLPEDRDAILEEMVESINMIYNVTAIYLPGYARTIDAFSLFRSVEHPDIADACHVNMTGMHSRGIHVAETRIKEGAAHLLKVLSDPDLKDVNALYPYVRLGVVSAHQVPQVMMAAGTRTDVNDIMIYRPIMAPYLRGMRDILDFAIDSLSAKKSLAYNRASLSTSRYEDRKQQLLSSILRNIHPGDCGTRVTVPFEITKTNHKACLGKLIVERGRLVELTANNVEQYIGKVVNMRSPIACRHTDGCCHACGGRMVQFMHPDTVIGIQSTIELMGPTAQLILSNKHFSTTTSMVYVPGEIFDGVLHVDRNEVTFAEGVDPRRVTLGIPFSCVSRISDLQYVDEGEAINDQHFSSIEAMTIVENKKNGRVIVPMSSMIDSNGSIPYLSADLLQYIKRNPDMMEVTEEMVWINLKKFDVSRPLMRCIVVNASMVRFARQIQMFFSKTVTKYTSATEVLRDFTNIVYSKLNTNLFHLEIIIRSSMITSANDYRIPVVIDVNDVKFGALRVLIMQRAIGGQLAYQEMSRYLEDPRTYTVPKPPGPFDALAGMFQPTNETPSVKS